MDRVKPLYPENLLQPRQDLHQFIQLYLMLIESWLDDQLENEDFDDEK